MVLFTSLLHDGSDKIIFGVGSKNGSRMANQFDFLAFPKSFPIPPITFHCHFLVPTPVFFLFRRLSKSTSVCSMLRCLVTRLFYAPFIQLNCDFHKSPNPRFSKKPQNIDARSNIFYSRDTLSRKTSFGTSWPTERSGQLYDPQHGSRDR